MLLPVLATFSSINYTEEKELDGPEKLFPLVIWKVSQGRDSQKTNQRAEEMGAPAQICNLSTKKMCVPCRVGLGDSILDVDLGIFPHLFCLSHEWSKQMIAAKTRVQILGPC